MRIGPNDKQILQSGKQEYIIFFIIRSIFLLLVVISPTQLFAWVPPSDSPIANGVHPRIYLISEAYKASHPNALGLTVTEIRNKLSSDSAYLIKLQELINEMDSQWSRGVTSTLSKDASYNAMNFAFLYIIDVTMLQGSSYNLTISTLHSTGEYGDKAVEYARHIASNLKSFTSVTTNKRDWLDYTIFDYSNNENYGASNIALAVVNDWVIDKVTKSDRQDFIQATKSAYDYKYNGNTVAAFAAAKQYGVQQNGMAVLGLYGDDVDDGSSTTYRDMLDGLLDNFKNLWIDGFVGLHNKFYTGGVSSAEGVAYQQTAYKNTSIFVPAMSTALNVNYYEQTGWLKYAPLYYLYSVNPRKFTNGDEYRWMMFQDTAAGDRYDKNFGRVPQMIMNPTIYFLADGDHSDSKDLASLFKWIRDQSGWMKGSDGSNVQLRWLLFELLFTDRHKSVIAKSPTSLGLPLSKNIGNGRFFSLTAHNDQDTTLVRFEAPTWFNGNGGHNHKMFGAFEIYKYGHLTTTRNTGKGFSGSGSKKTGTNPWYNVIGVRSQEEIDSNPNGEYYAEFRGGFKNKEIDPNAADWQVNGANHVGTIVVSDINNSKYDYIDYDYSNAWNDSKVDYAERQFVNLRSAGGTNDEYVIVFDRVNTPNASDTTKYWFLQAQYDAPKLLNNSGSEVTMTAENYPDDPDSGGGRWVRNDSTPTQNNVIELNASWSGNNAHGRLFNKTLLPLSFQINKTGGPGHYWEDMRGRLMLTKTLTDREKYYRGTYTIQVQSTTGQQYDNFLNVMQIGDAATLTSMTPTTRIDGDTMVGAQIDDATVPRIVMFSNDSNGASVISATYTVSYPSSKLGRHLLSNISPGLYDIYRGGSKIFSNLTASLAFGTLSFEATGAAIFQVVRAGNLPPDLPPAPPTGLVIN